MQSLNHVRRGIANVWVVMTLFLMVALTGLACDCGWVVLVLTQLQSAADSAALAGAARVKFDQAAARAAAVDLGDSNNAALAPVLLATNDGNAIDGDIVVGVWDHINHTFTPGTISPNAVKVNARREGGSLNGALNLVFGSTFGVNTVDIAREAIAVTGGFPGGGVLVLDPSSNCAFSIGGNSTLTVTGGAVQVNSTSSCGACSNGQPDLFADALYVSGGACVSGNVYGGQIYNGAPPVPDPLASLPVPNFASLTPYPPGSANHPAGNGETGTEIQTISPGIYPKGIDRNGGTLTMQPGIYVLRATQNGQGFNINNATVVGNGVMIYLDADTTRDARLDFAGAGNVELSPMTTGPYAGVTIFQARENQALAQINGTNSMNITGTLYFPSNRLDLRGDGDGFANQIIAWQLSISGDANVNIPYNGAFPLQPNFVFLVK